MGETVIYEAHVKGLTLLNPQLPEAIRGTYKALGHPAMIAYFKSLGISALELFAGGAVRQRAATAADGVKQLLGLQPVGVVRAGSALRQRPGSRPG